VAYIRPVLTYSCEAWATTKGDDKKLMTFERKARRKYTTITSIQQYEIRHDDDLRNLFERHDVVAFVKSKRIHNDVWACLESGRKRNDWEIPYTRNQIGEYLVEDKDKDG